MEDQGDALPPGTRLDEFEIDRVLGAGGFGVTYLARDLSLDAWRAVKEYLPRHWGTRRTDGTIGPRAGGDAEDYRWGLDRFLEEARILARFDHRHLVRVYRVFEGRGTAYMVTEYVAGRTLAAEAASTIFTSYGGVRLHPQQSVSLYLPMPCSLIVSAEPSPERSVGVSGYPPF